ncbi:hypothetical protein SASPL_116356 [Salvia splendens]|uniref:Callose synthase n=1 Tax=Salvia splendens TaxID=180675 RepID=A0A8X8XVY9_SALSN|nr:hypothetical protein SASPL_116356 [Salvia splendens]
MSRVEDLWERLVRAALRGRAPGGGLYRQPETGLAANVPSSLGNKDIDDILRAADEIQDDDPNIARILNARKLCPACQKTRCFPFALPHTHSGLLFPLLAVCEHAYSLAQNLDPNSEGRGVLQFKTGLMSVIKQKLAKKEAGSIDRTQDIARLREFYKLYRQKNNVDRLREEEMELRQSGVFSGNLGELERKTVKRKRVLATLRVIGNVLGQLTKDVSAEEAQSLIPEELKRVIESDAAMAEDTLPYNIIPLDAPSLTNRIASFPEKDSVSNQREQVVHLLAMSKVGYEFLKTQSL